MKKLMELRGNTAAKCAAIVLLVLVTACMAAGCCIVFVQSYGYGVYDMSEDPIFQNDMDRAMRTALDNVLDPGPQKTSDLLNRYAGFSAKIYDGDPAEENYTGGWSEIPDVLLVERTGVYSKAGASSGYYTVTGYVAANQLPTYSVFHRDLLLYNFLHSFNYTATLIATILLLLAAAALLAFLLSAAGHRAGKTGIFPNWLDRVPLDLYLCCAIPLLVVALVFDYEYILSVSMTTPLLIYSAPLVIALLATGGLILATLMTLSTRLKLGRWWRNSICWSVLRRCKKIWRDCWDAAAHFIRLLPMTWRTILAVGGVLLLQTLLTLLMFESYNGGFFFLIALVTDTSLIVGAAWLTRQLQMVQDMGKALAAGDLEAKLDTKKLFWDIKSHAECLNAIGVGMNEAVERRMRSERLKTELITNVSHDIKTPLTSIVNYVDLLQKEDLPPAAAEYTAVLDRQAKRLKKLTEDLVEASKASTGNVSVHLEPIVVNEIIHQAIGDYDERLTAGKLEIIVNTYEGNLIALTDGRLLWRVLDNLLSNVCKYAMAGTRVYLDLGTQDGAVLLTMKNISRDPLNVNAEELMERFVRGDTSRHTEGSGLGLNIARSLMDLMGGSFRLSVDGDLFKAELTLKMVAQKPWEKPIELKAFDQETV